MSREQVEATLTQAVHGGVIVLSVARRLLAKFDDGTMTGEQIVAGLADRRKLSVQKRQELDWKHRQRRARRNPWVRASRDRFLARHAVRGEITLVRGRLRFGDSPRRPVYRARERQPQRTRVARRSRAAAQDPDEPEPSLDRLGVSPGFRHELARLAAFAPEPYASQRVAMSPRGRP